MNAPRKPGTAGTPIARYQRIRNYIEAGSSLVIGPRGTAYRSSTSAYRCVPAPG